MGWWSGAVMGGDTPSDMECEFNEIVGIEDEGLFGRFVGAKIDMENSPPEAIKELQSTITAKLPELIAWADSHESNMFSDDDHIAYQVLGTLLMRYGVAISPEIRDKVISAAKEDRWAKNQLDNTDGEQDRVLAMNSLIDDVTSYVDGTPKELTLEDQGLLAQIDNVLDDDEPHLINR